MDQGLVIAILVAVIVLLVGLLTLLVVAAVLLALANRRAETEARDKKERVRKMPPRSAPSPTPVARVAGPPPGMGFLAVPEADEAATEVMSARHLAALFESEESTGTTEVRGLLGDDGHLQLEDTEETTELGRAASAEAPAKKN